MSKGPFINYGEGGGGKEKKENRGSQVDFAPLPPGNSLCLSGGNLTVAPFDE